MSAIPRRGFRWRLRENWYQEWSLGRYTFGIEWVPRANGYFLITLSRDSLPEIPS